MLRPDSSCLHIQNLLLSLQNKRHCRTNVQILDCTKLQIAAEKKTYMLNTVTCQNYAVHTSSIKTVSTLDALQLALRLQITRRGDA